MESSKTIGSLPAPLALLSWLCIGNAHLKHGWNWETKFDGKRYRSIQKFQVRELLEVSASRSAMALKESAWPNFKKGTELKDDGRTDELRLK
jgi:hypothetical protein